jgi:hypothetical protein
VLAYKLQQFFDAHRRIRMVVSSSRQLQRFSDILEHGPNSLGIVLMLFRRSGAVV